MEKTFEEKEREITRKFNKRVSRLPLILDGGEFKDGNNKTRNNTIQEATDELLEFLESDLWYSFNEEFKSEEDMIKYLRSHFGILDKQIKNIGKRKKHIVSSDR